MYLGARDFKDCGQYKKSIIHRKIIYDYIEFAFDSGYFQNGNDQYVLIIEEEEET